MINAEIIQHTRSGNTELITVQVDLHRFIIAQVNTHRYFSRNYQSSRAMPILKQMEQIRENPAMPVVYGTAQKGMVAGDALTGWKLKAAKGLIYGLSRVSLFAVGLMQKLGLSKEIANRYLEPWMYTRGIITATKKDWEAFFKLRCAKDAQPEIQVLANKIKDAIDNSVAFELKPGEWHVPYCTYARVEVSGELLYRFQGMTETNIRNVVRKGTSASGQISYRTLDLSKDKVERVYEMLKLPENGVYPDDKSPHYSAAEHCAMADDEYQNKATDYDDTVDWLMNASGNFHTEQYIQYRKMLEYGCDGLYLGDN
jgi:Thymidylate synthase complementing protein